MKKGVLMLLISVVTIVTACGDGESVEASKMIGLSEAITFYQTANSGRLPNNWLELQPYYNVDAANYDLVGTSGYPMQDHYQFVTQPLVLPNMGLLIDGSQVLLIRTVPLALKADMDSTDAREWRYVIYQGKNGQIASASISEKDIQLMLKKAGITITRKAGLPTVEQYERISPPMRTPNQSGSEKKGTGTRRS